MAIQNRRGVYNNFTPSKMVPGEFAVVQNGDPNGKDGKAVYIAFGAGDARRLATADDIEQEIETSTESIAADLVQRFEDAVADDLEAAQTAATNASTSAQTAATKASEAAASATQAAQTVANIIDTTLTQTGKAADAKVVGDELDSLKGDLNSISHFDLIAVDKSTSIKLSAYFRTDTAISADDNTKMLYFECYPNSIYVINKTLSARFRVGYTAILPAIGVDVLGAIADNDATSITLITGDNAHYVVVYYYDGNNDTLSESEIYTSITISGKINATAIDRTARNGKVDKQQSVSDAGKALVVGSNGIVYPEKIDIPDGLSNNAKVALLNCFQHVAWIDDQGQTYYNALEDALYESVDTAYIEAVYSAKSWGKYAGDSVNSLKTDLIVTYYARQGAVGVNVPAENYTLTGNMVAGLQAFIVTYRGKIATFNAQILNGLPSGYTKLQYVQTDGRQYIDTGISETQVDSAIYKMRVTGIAAGTDSYASGQHFFSSANFFFPFLKKGTSGEVTFSRFGNQRLISGSQALAWDADIDYEFKAYIDNDAVFVNGQQLFETVEGSTKDSTKKMHLFTFGGYPNMEKFRFCGRFYGLTVYGQAGDVVLSLIPAKNSNNVAGVYDAISGSFFTSNTEYPLQAGEVA